MEEEMNKNCRTMTMCSIHPRYHANDSENSRIAHAKFLFKGYMGIVTITMLIDPSMLLSFYAAAKATRCIQTPSPPCRQVTIGRVALARELVGDDRWPLFCRDRSRQRSFATR